MSTNVPSQGLVLGSKLYDRVKFTVQILLPALATFYTLLSGLWGLPDVKEVVGTLTGLAFFLGTITHISSANYTPPVTTGTPVGTFVVSETPEGKKTVRLDLDKDPEAFIGNEAITFNTAREDAGFTAVDDPNAPREENLS